ARGWGAVGLAGGAPRGVHVRGPILAWSAGCPADLSRAGGAPGTRPAGGPEASGSAPAGAVTSARLRGARPGVAGRGAGSGAAARHPDAESGRVHEQTRSRT